MAPLTAIMAASAVVFGSWTIILYALAWFAIRLRMATKDDWWKHEFVAGTLGQLGIAVVAAYCTIVTWQGVSLPDADGAEVPT